MNLVNSGAQFKVEVTGYDLMQFADNLIKRAMEEQRILDATRQQQESALPTGDGETYLTSQEAAKMCNVCITTLWSWAKAGYLVPCKICQLQPGGPHRLRPDFVQGGRPAEELQQSPVR